MNLMHTLARFVSNFEFIHRQRPLVTAPYSGLNRILTQFIDFNSTNAEFEILTINKLELSSNSFYSGLNLDQPHIDYEDEC